MKKIFITLISIFMMFFCFGASAAQDVTVDAKLNIDTLNIDVKLEGFSSNSRITLVAASDGNLTAAEASENLVYLSQHYTDVYGCGSISVSFMPSASGGRYVLFVTDSSSGRSYRSNSFDYLSKSSANDVMIAINGASAGDFVSVLEQNAAVVLLDMSEYIKLSSSDKIKVTDMLYALRPSNGFAGVGELHSKFGSCLLTVALKSSDDALALFEKYAHTLDTDVSDYNSLTSQEKLSAVGVIKEKSFSNPGQAAAFLPEAVFAAKANCADTAGELKAYIMTDYASVLQLDLSKYNKLANTTKVFSYLLECDFKGYASAAELFAEAVESAAGSQGSASTGGSSAGGSSFGGAGLPSSPPVTSVPAADVLQSSYSDMDDALWAKEDVEYLTSKGIISGDGTGAFRPNDTITRAEFVKMLVSALGIESSNISVHFDDVADDAWYADYVNAAADVGIVNGVSDKLFAPLQNISRQDLALMCYRGAGVMSLSLNEVSDTKPLDAETISDYALDAVLKFYRCQIVNGTPDGNFNPADTATRAQVAKIVAQLHKIKEGQLK